MYRHILIATDGSELAGKAVTTGLSLGKQLNAKITAVTRAEARARPPRPRISHLRSHRFRHPDGIGRGHNRAEPMPTRHCDPGSTL